jgi:hypothetical protein
MTDTFGIANKITYQFYPDASGGGFRGIEENEYFAPTKAEKGPQVDQYSAQMIFAFLQRSALFEADFFRDLLQGNTIPAYYRKWIEMALDQKDIEDVYHRTEINIPQKTYFREDILKAVKS